MLLLKNVRLSFPHLFTAQSFQNEGEPKYSTVLLIPKGSDAHKQIEAEIRRVATDAFGDGAKAIVERQNATNRKLLRDGDDAVDGYTQSGEPKNGYAGNVYIKASTKTAPKVVGRSRQPITEADGIIYAGAIVNAQIDIWAQKNQFGKAVNCKLLAIQFWADGDRLGGDSGANVDAFETADEDLPSW